MNYSDTEVVMRILEDRGFVRTLDPSSADVYLVVTCALREGAEDKVWRKLRHIRRKKKARVYRLGNIKHIFTSLNGSMKLKLSIARSLVLKI